MDLIIPVSWDYLPDARCLAECLAFSKDSVMLLPLEIGTFLFKYVFWSDNSEVHLEVLS